MTRAWNPSDHEVQPLPLAVVRLQANPRVPRHPAAHARHAQAALPVLHLLLGERRDFRVDIDRQRNVRGVRIARVLRHLHHHDLLRHVHLRGGQAGAVVFIHGLDHVVDELLYLRRRDLIRRHRLGDLPQHRVPQSSYLENQCALLPVKTDRPEP